MIRTNFNGEPDKIYYDIDIINNTEGNIESNFPLQFTETRPVQFIERGTDYYLSVVRFNLGLPNLPFFIPKIKSNQSNRNLTIYKVIVQFGTFNQAIDVIWIPQDLTAKLPNEPIVNQEFSSYYFAYTPQHFINVLNSAIFTALGDNAYLQLNPDTNNIELICQDIFYQDNPPIIGFNDPLKNLLSTFTYTKQPPPSGSTYIEPYFWKLNFTTFGTKYPQAGLGYNIMSTYTCPLSTWSCVSSIIFTSSIIPVIPNAVAPEKFFNSNNTLPSQSGTNNTSNMITDFQVSIGPNSFYNPSISYLPTAEYRLISLFGDSGLNQVQISVFWKDNFGGLHLIYLGNNCSGSIKLMFDKKKNLK